MSTFILVAGSFHGGWSWRRTARLLRARGHEVYAPSLTGMGERAHLTTPDGIGLATHVDDVLAVVDAEELTDVVLVGHSYAGVVVGSVVDRRPEPFRRVVYLDALVPEDGRSVIDLLGPPAATSWTGPTRRPGSSRSTRSRSTAGAWSARPTATGSAGGRARSRSRRSPTRPR
ncbi:alpha/beta fold hydrolase [Pseudonocardia benzenivorans]